MDVRECTRAQTDEDNNYAGAITGAFITFGRSFGIVEASCPPHEIAQHEQDCPIRMME